MMSILLYIIIIKLIVILSNDILQYIIIFIFLICFTTVQVCIRALKVVPSCHPGYVSNTRLKTIHFTACLATVEKIITYGHEECDPRSTQDGRTSSEMWRPDVYYYYA